MRLRHGLVAVMLAAALPVGGGSTARAQEAEVDPTLRASARQLAREGQDLFRDGDYAAALDRYERAAKLVDVPTVHVRAARCLVKLGRLVEGAERYRSVIRKGVAADARPVLKQAIEDATQELEQLRPRVPWTLVKVVGPRQGATLELDGRPLPPALWDVRTAVDPGEHTLVAKRGGKQNEQRFSVEEGKTAEVQIELPPPVATPPPPPPKPLLPPPPPPPPPPPQGSSVQVPLGWTLVGLGGAGLIAGAVVGGLAVDLGGQLEGACGSELACPPLYHDDVDQYNAMRISTTVLLLAGAGLAATGVVTLVTAPSGDEVSVALSPGSVALRVRY